MAQPQSRPEITDPLNPSHSNRVSNENSSLASFPPPKPTHYEQPPSLASIPPTLLIFFSSIFFSLMNSSVRYTTSQHNLPVLLAAFSRGVIQFLTSSIILFHISPPPPSFPSLMTLSLRALLGSLSMISKYVALSHLPIAVASALFATAPFFTTILACIFLRENLTVADIIALLTTSLGALLVAYATMLHSSHQAVELTGVAFALLASCFTATVFVIVRFLGHKVHFMHNVFALSIGCMVASVAIVVITDGGAGVYRVFGVVPGLGIEELLGLVGVGAFAFLGATCLNRGLQWIRAGRAAVIRTSDTPINFLVGALLFGEMPVAWGQICGCVLIVAGTLYVSLNRNGPVRGSELRNGVQQ